MHILYKTRKLACTRNSIFVIRNRAPLFGVKENMVAMIQSLFNMRPIIAILGLIVNVTFHPNIAQLLEKLCIIVVDEIIASADQP